MVSEEAAEMQQWMCTGYYAGARLDSISKEGGGGVLLVAMSAAKAAVSTGMSSA